MKLNKKIILSTGMLDNKRDQPHDKYFKSIMAKKENAIDFFNRRLPIHIKKAVDLESLELRKGSYIDKNMKKYELDILYKVNFNDKPGYLYTLVEHQSTIDKLMPIRVLKYMLEIMSNHYTEHQQLPLIYSIVLYNGKTSYTASTNLLNMFENHERELAKEMLTNPCHIIDLTEEDSNTLKSHIRSGLMEYILKHIYLKDIYQVLTDASKELRELEQKDYDNLLTLLKYIIMVNINNAEQVERFIEETLIDKDKTMGTLAEHWMQQGVQKGLEQGVLQGREEGMHLVALNMLQKNVDKNFISEVTGLSLAELRNLEGDI